MLVCEILMVHQVTAGVHDEATVNEMHIRRGCFSSVVTGIATRHPIKFDENMLHCNNISSRQCHSEVDITSSYYNMNQLLSSSLQRTGGLIDN